MPRRARRMIGGAAAAARARAGRGARGIARAIARACAAACALAACGDNAAPPAPCLETCGDGAGGAPGAADACPYGLACVAGVCAAPGTSCPISFTAVRAGAGWACALDQLGRAWCWGDNAHHQVAPDDAPVIARMTVRGPARWDALAVGGGHACALADGALWCWGENDRGQVDYLTEGDFAAPAQVVVPGGPARWDQVATGYRHTCAIGDGRLYCWGAGDLGQLGTGLADDDQPRPIAPTITDWRAVSAGDHHTCAISAAQGLFCWGDNSSGELGDGTVLVRYTPTPVPLPGAAAVATAAASTCAIDAGGALWCWGRASDGALGDPARVEPGAGLRVTPTSATALGGWSQLGAAERALCARRGGEVWCWGTAVGGGLGAGVWATARGWAKILDGATDLAVGWNRDPIDSATDASDLDLGCAIVGGEVRCWGDDRFGQLGNGAATRALTPRPVGDGGSTWSALAVGAAHACAVTASGEVDCWGATTRGQVAGVATGADAAAPCVAGGACDVGAPTAIATGGAAVELSAGAAHTCARDAAGAVTCWGDDALGQCGASAAAGAVPPTSVAGAWDRLLARGGDGTCAQDAAGAVTCWGRAVATGAPAAVPALAGAAEVVLGVGFGCARDGNDALACWGDDARAQFGNGGPGTCGDGACNHGETAATCAADCGAGPLTALGRRYTQLAAGWGSPFACGVTPAGGVECWGANDRGQAGAPDPDVYVADPAPTPYALPMLSGCTRVAAGAAHACALCGGAIACWGDARLGQLGAPLAELPVLVPRAIAAPLPAGDAWTDLAAGATFTCARSAAGRVACWGLGRHGELGDGATGANLPVPVRP